MEDKGFLKFLSNQILLYLEDTHVAAPFCSLFPANIGFLKEDICQVKVGSQGSCWDSEPEVVLNNTARNVNPTKNIFDYTRHHTH